jgi:CubicO group peptidase (beta-lactamase class C family)
MKYMKPRKIIFLCLLTLLISGLIVVVVYCNKTLPIVNGYSAKMMCSEVFIGGRAPEDITRQDLHSFPLSLSTCKVNYKDSSVTASIWGLYSRKAFFVSGRGATLVSELKENDIRKQVFGVPARPLADRNDIAWPFGDKVADTIPANVDTAKIREAVDFLFAEQNVKRLKNTRAALVVYKGQIIAERYAPGFNSSSRLLGWSMAKSITSAVTGLLVKKGLINPDTCVAVNEWSRDKDARHVITVKNLLQQCSGLSFEESYSKSADATIMLYEKADMGAYAAHLPLATTPGTKFRYTSGNANILSDLIRKVAGTQDYHALPYRELFYKLGMYNTVWEMDASGAYVGSSYIYASARDWARFGLLYLNKGYFNNEQILPASWIEQSVTPSAAQNFDRYGYLFWLNTGKKKGEVNRAYPHAPDDMYYANGFQGQNVFIIPSKDLVIVRMGLTVAGGYRADESLNMILQAIH